MAKFFFVVGVLMVVLCGGCTLLIFIDSIGARDEYGIVALSMFIGGIPAGIGLVIALAARHAMRRANPPEN